MKREADGSGEGGGKKGGKLLQNFKLQKCIYVFGWMDGCSVVGSGVGDSGKSACVYAYT